MGAAEPACCRSTAQVVGMSWREAVFIATKVTMALLATQGSSGIAQTQQIGGKIHADGLHGGAALRHRGEQPPGEGMQQPGQRFRKAAAAGNLHQAAPQAQHAG